MEIYLDNSATTRPCPAAVEACRYAMETEYGNPSSLHGKGFEAEKLVIRAKEQVASALRCDPQEIYFTSGATESNNTVLFGVASAHKRQGKTIITTAVEHPSVLEPAGILEKQGFTVKRLSPESGGRYTPEQFADAVDGDTILVSAMFVNNETGLILPVAEIAAAVKARKPDLLFHTDAVQGFLKLPLSLRNTKIDLLSVSGHKVEAVKGVGGLYIRKGVRIAPLLYGGGQQEGIRPGTVPVPLIASFGAAAAVQEQNMAARYSRYVSLKNRLLEKVSLVDGIAVQSGEGCSPHIISVAAEGIRSEILLHFLEQKGIYVSSGSACSKGKASYALTALGIGKPASDETVRVSFGSDTTEEMVDRLVDGIAEALCVLQRRRR